MFVKVRDEQQPLEDRDVGRLRVSLAIGGSAALLGIDLGELEKGLADGAFDQIFTRVAIGMGREQFGPEKDRLGQTPHTLVTQPRVNQGEQGRHHRFLVGDQIATLRPPRLYRVEDPSDHEPGDRTDDEKELRLLPHRDRPEHADRERHEEHGKVDRRELPTMQAVCLKACELGRQLVEDGIEVSHSESSGFVRIRNSPEPARPRRPRKSRDNGNRRCPRRGSKENSPPRC